MAFYDTQLGRFGELCSMHFGIHGDPDLRAAHALAINGTSSPPCPDLQAVLGTKMLSESNDPVWQPWSAAFSSLLSQYQTKGGNPLTGYCPKTWGSLPPGFCMHELTSPLRYWGLRSFANRMRGTTVHLREDGSLEVDLSVKPLWNYVITARGEILVASEDFGWIKHSSIAGGHKVWSAGQIGLENGRLRLVDLQSGHYIVGIHSNIVPGSILANELIDFTESVFREYFAVFALPNLHPDFKCIWG